MTLDARLHALGRDARRRRAAIALALGAPIVLVSIAAGFRLAAMPGALVAALVSIAALSFAARRAMRVVDDAWIARRLDASDRSLEDSADLLFRDATDLSPLQRLQRDRVRERLTSHAAADIAPAWPWRAVVLVWTAGVIATAFVALVSRPSLRTADAVSPVSKTGAQATRLDRVRLDIVAPAYTRAAARTQAALDAQVPEGSRIAWHLRMAPVPKTAALGFHDGSRVELVRAGDEWTGVRTLAASALYRIVLEDAPPVEDDRLHRLDVIADRAPEVRVIRPDKSLTLLADGQRDWDLDFEASDDYGIAAASLTITLAQGSGENIAFSEQTLALAGEDLDDAGAGRHRRFRHTLDLGELGFARGDDLIVRLAVSDNREPDANTTKSASFILRWPPESASDSVGMEGLVERTMPAYFRSQRQIIIDTQNLVAEQPKLDDDAVLARSDGIGVDQKILRLRYGQFLGEEFEKRSEVAGPEDEKHGHDEGDAARADALTKREEEHKHFLDVQRFGDAGAVTAEFGHTHDYAEAATLLDPETKSILKAALNEMWQAELHLRQGRPAEALPFENKALAYIKQVQQSSRIYLARVGLDLPALDEGRRLSGDRKGVSDRESPLVRADADDSGALAVWQALDAHETPDLDAFERWLRTRDNASGDVLALLAAADRLRRESECAECRQELRGLLWPLLPKPAAAAQPRAAPDAAGRAYLDALDAQARTSGAPR